MRRGGYVLLDVVLAIMILAIVVLMAMRSFHQSLDLVRRGEIMSRASMYAEAKIQEFQINPPDEDTELNGRFGDDPFYSDIYLYPDADDYYWFADFEIEEIEYEVVDVDLTEEEEELMRPLISMHFRVVHDDGRGGYERWVALDINTYLIEWERFSLNARQENFML